MVESFLYLPTFVPKPITMRFLFLFFIAASLSSSLSAQITDTTKVNADTVAKAGAVNAIMVDTTESIPSADSVIVRISAPIILNDTIAAPADSTSAVIIPVESDSTVVNNAPDATVVPIETIDPNYIYSTLIPAMALAKRNVKEKTDTIVMLNGDMILANVKKFTFRDLFYGFPGDVRMVAVDRRYVQKIIYKYGRVETISSREVEVREVGAWREVKVLKRRTANLKDMIEVGEVEGVDEGTREKYVDARDLERSATITMQKKAALLGATIVLITTRDVRRPYGDPPYVRLVGMAYKPR